MPLPMILVVDDDTYINEMVQKALTAEGFEVLSAYSGTEVLLLLIAFLQGWDHLPSEFDDVLAQAREAFLSHPDELCALIESEF